VDGCFGGKKGKKGNNARDQRDTTGGRHSERAPRPANPITVMGKNSLKVPPSASPATEDEVNRLRAERNSNGASSQPTKESRRQRPGKKPSNEKPSQPPNAKNEKGSSSHRGRNRDTIQERDDPLAVPPSKEERSKMAKESMNKSPEQSGGLEGFLSENLDPEGRKRLDEMKSENPVAYNIAMNTIQERDDPLAVPPSKEEKEERSKMERKLNDIKDPHEFIASQRIKIDIDNLTPEMLEEMKRQTAENIGMTAIMNGKPK